MVVGKNAGDDNNTSEDNAKVKIVIWWLFKGGGLNRVGQKTKDSA